MALFNKKKEGVYRLTMNEVEVQVVKTLLLMVRGDPEKSYRKISDDLLKAIRAGSEGYIPDLRVYLDKQDIGFYDSNLDQDSPVGESHD